MGSEALLNVLNVKIVVSHVVAIVLIVQGGVGIQQINASFTSRSTTNCGLSSI